MTSHAHRRSFDTLSLIRNALVVFTVGFLIWITVAGLYADTRMAGLSSGQKDPVQHGHLLISSGQVAYPNEWVETARLVSTASPQHDPLAISLLEMTTAADPANYEAWTLLAFLQTRSQNRVTEAATQALTRSFETCPLCDEDLLKWRLTFVLTHWAEIDEASRRAAFEGADILRWWFLDYDYLAQVRDDARARGIPFDEYRKKVGTAVRPNEIGLDRD